MLRHIIARALPRTNRVTMFVRLPDGTIRTLAPTYFENRPAIRGCDQVYLREGIQAAMLRIAHLVFDSQPSTDDLCSVLEYDLKNLSANTKKVYLVVCTVGFEPTEEVKKHLINPEDPPPFYNPSHRKLLKEFAVAVQARLGGESDKTLVQQEVDAA
jgi:hypothetical protein